MVSFDEEDSSIAAAVVKNYQSETNNKIEILIFDTATGDIHQQY